MARKVSFSVLESRSARLRSKIRRRPYSGPSLARGISLMYRRNKTNETWVLKASDGHGSYWTKSFALADDFEDADAKNVLTFYQAQDAAKRLARVEDGSADSAPITVHGALKDCRRDLEARNANPHNAESPRVHLTKALLGKPVQLLNAHELKKWRDGLLGKIAPATINRVCRCLCAVLEITREPRHWQIYCRSPLVTLLGHLVIWVISFAVTVSRRAATSEKLSVVFVSPTHLLNGSPFAVRRVDFGQLLRFFPALRHRNCNTI
jgi:hypothetical protein